MSALLPDPVPAVDGHQARIELAPSGVTRWKVLQIVWAASGLALLGVTWRLWTGTSRFPQVPLWSGAGSIPSWADYPVFAVLAGALLLVGLVGLLPIGRPSGEGSRWAARCCLVVAVALAWLFVGNQHRLQPWAWQMWIFAILFAGHRPAPGMIWMRRLVISIYVYSAIGKFDYQFLHTVGQQFFLDQLVGWSGQQIDLWPRAVRLWAAASLPAAELLVALGLACPVTRRWSAWAAAVLHVMLIAMLGPWGLGHRGGVLVWNGYSAVQAVLLFGSDGKGAVPSRDGASESEQRRLSRRISRSAVVLLVVATIALPALESLGWWDHWLSWGLYSPRNSRVVLEVHESQLQRLPDELQALTAARGEWRKVDLDRWSLRSLAVPIYPQDRFQLGVALAVAQRMGRNPAVRVHWLGIADRFSGQRRHRLWVGLPAIQSGTRSFLVNAESAGAR